MEVKTGAWVATQPGKELEWRERRLEPQAGQVVIDVQSCSVTRGDTWFIDNHWGDSPYPFVGGLEIMGRVRQDDGPGAEFKPGETVGVGYQVGACFNCEFCGAGQEQFCADQQLIPLQAAGGFAEVLAVDRRFVFRMPAHLQEPAATPLLCAGLTVFSAIQAAQVETNARVGVVGIGGLGHLAVKFLKAMDCQVTAFTHSEQKREAILNLGADRVIMHDETVPERALDFIIACASDGVVLDRYVRALRPQGTLSIVGLPSEKLSLTSELLADLAARQVRGGYIGSRQDMTDMLNFAAQHGITAEAEYYPLKEINRVIEDVRRSVVPFGAVLTRHS